MKKILFSFLSLMGLSFPAFAQSHINIELLGATYTTPAVQFRVSWNSIPSVTGETHNSKIWLWVDFIKIENNQSSGSWTRATIANPSPGTVAAETNKGFWLQGNNDSYNQIVTVTLTNISANTTFNWCAYASDYPPNMTYVDGNFIFKGTPPFTLKPSSGTVTRTVQNKILSATTLTFVPAKLTDVTECPGIINWIGCNWGNFNLGTISFVSSATYQVGTQIWSAPVQTTGCSAKTTYDGGSAGNYNIDCRNHTTVAYGDLFSWCIVVKYADQLCPSPWRVPSYEDFKNLDIAMGGDGTCNKGMNAPNSRYLSSSWFGGVLSNFVYGDNTWYSTPIVNYIGLSERTSTSTHFMGTEIIGSDSNKQCCACCWHYKEWGNTLRCVRTN